MWWTFSASWKHFASSGAADNPQVPGLVLNVSFGASIRARSGQRQPNNTMTWRGRFRTAIAMAQLLLAVAMVRFVPMRVWRGCLGSLADPHAAPMRKPGNAVLRIAYQRAFHVMRAASHFPFTVKCLPQAMVLQWQMRRSRIASNLVIAMLKSSRSASQDPYHAWVELGGIMILGYCERSDYAVLMTLSHQPV